MGPSFPPQTVRGAVARLGSQRCSGSMLSLVWFQSNKAGLWAASLQPLCWPTSLLYGRGNGGPREETGCPTRATHPDSSRPSLHCAHRGLRALQPKITFALVDQQPVRAPELNGVSNLQAFQVLGHLPSSRELGMGVFEVNLQDTPSPQAPFPGSPG